MSAPASSLEPESGAAPEPQRREVRTETVRIAEYARFPRMGDAAWRRAATRDLSELGLGLVTDRPEREGALLRVVLRDLFGHVIREAVLRVVWCRPEGGGRHRVGLESLAENTRTMALVRRTAAGGRERS